jgi:glucose/arabinose dehydrogenase
MPRAVLIYLLISLYSCNSNTSHQNASSKNDTINKTVTVAPDTSHSVAEEDKQSEVLINNDAVAIKLSPVQINLKKGINFTLEVPVGYKVSVAAEGLRRLRFLAKSPDGRLFATDMYDRSDNRKGTVVIFTDWIESERRFARVDTFLEKLHNPNQVAFFDGYIYVAETGKLSRYKFNKGDTKPSYAAEVIATFPDHGLSYKYGGWHLTRSIAFHNNKLYVSVGSSCNACVEKEEVRASILEMNSDGTDQKMFARGLRNSVGIKWVGNKLWGTGMGRDLIGPDKPEDLFQEIKRGEFYGWPYYYQYQNKIYADEQFRDSSRPSWVKKPPVAFCGFKAHSAPLGFDHFAGFADPQLNNAFLVALHGSTMVSRQRGNSVVKVIGGNKYVDVVRGFLGGKTEAQRCGRPCDVMMNDQKSFFVTDDHNGVLYYFYRF